MFGKRNDARREWRRQDGGITLSACLRSVHENPYAHANELDAQLSQRYGGPPV